MHFHGWKSGLKTGMYYLRSKASCPPPLATTLDHCPPLTSPCLCSKAAADAIKFTVDQQQLQKKHTQDAQKEREDAAAPQPAEEQECLSCGA